MLMLYGLFLAATSCSSTLIATRLPCGADVGNIVPLVFPARPSATVINGDLVSILAMLRVDINEDNTRKTLLLEQLRKCNGVNTPAPP